MSRRDLDGAVRVEYSAVVVYTAVSRSIKCTLTATLESQLRGVAVPRLGNGRCGRCAPLGGARRASNVPRLERAEARRVAPPRLLSAWRGHAIPLPWG